MTIQEADVKLFKPVQVKRIFAEGGKLPFVNRRSSMVVASRGGVVSPVDDDRIAVVMPEPPLPQIVPEELRERLAAAGFRSRREIIADYEDRAASTAAGDQVPVVGTLVGEAERLVAIELRAELLRVLQRVGADVIARLHICRGCGALFLAKRRGGTVKWCPSCRK